MHLAQQIVVLVHLVGFAALLGGILVQTRAPEPEVNATMLWGGWTELGSGVVLVALALAAGDDQPRDGAGDETDDDETDDEAEHVEPFWRTWAG